MRTHLASLAMLFALSPLAALAANKTAMPAQDTVAITRHLERYEKALNTSDVDAVMRLYSDDAVLMPQHSLPVAGANAIRSAYQQIFKTIRLSIDFTIDEIQPLSQDWAFARTRSNGTVKTLASDAPAGPEANQELFLLHRGNDGQWRVARYIFTTTNPPRQQ